MTQTKKQRMKPHKSARKTVGQKGREPKAMSTGARAGWVPGMEKLYKPLKRPVTLRLDADVIAWFQNGGRGYQTRINRALRHMMLKEQKARS